MVKRKSPPAASLKNDRQTGLVFPCEFTIKVFGMANDDFEIHALSIIRKHITDLREDALRTRASKDGKYLALSITIHVDSRAELDAIYRELTSSPSVLIAL